MRSIKRRFEQVQKTEPGRSSYTSFAKAISKQGFTKRVLSYWFNKLVDKDDYQSAEKRSLVEHLCHLSKLSEDSTKMTEITAETKENYKLVVTVI